MITSKKLLGSNTENDRYLPDNKKMTLEAITNDGGRWTK
jgi:hypothetical protein